jgi:heme-degrading monooxygenase HmoA
MILRTWRGWVAADRADEYAQYVERTGLSEYRATAGNRGCQLVTRDLGDGRCEVLTLSWWDSLEVIRGFAGDDIEVAKFYPDDDEFLIDRETVTHHYRVRGGMVDEDRGP